MIGTEDAIKTELSEVLARIRGSEGEEMRARMEGLREKCKASWKNGMSRKAMIDVAKLFE